MKVNTAELRGAALDWAVAVANGRNITWDGISRWVDDVKGCKPIGPDWKQNNKPCGYSPSTVWNDGGTIIEQEGVCVHIQRDEPGFIFPPNRRWWAQLDGRVHTAYGPTPLIAAMRCYVASRLGYEVDVPEELLT